MFAAMAFYLLKIHKVIQIMPKMRSAENCWHAVHANVRQIARLPEQRCWQKRRNVGKLPTAPAAAQKANFRAKKKSFQPMLFARLARRTREHQPERIACLGIESSGSRTHDLLLRRDAHRFPFRELHCPVMPDFPAFPADFYVFDGGQRNVKSRNFQPCC